VKTEGITMKKAAFITSSAILAILIIAALFTALPKVFGLKIYTVMSSSMEKRLSPGDLIYVAPTDGDKIKKDDIISFVLNKDLTVVTHRVVVADRANKQFITKGDANKGNDAAPVIYGNVLGVVKFSVPKLGYLFHYVNTTGGRVVSISCIVLLAVISFLLSDNKKKPVS